MTAGPSRSGRGVLLAAATLAGAGTMAVELAAVRLLAPWFGTSQAVWTQVIGVVLLGLTVGYLLGGRFSRRPGAAGRMALLLGLAAAWTAALPALVGPVAGAFVPEGLTLDRAFDVLRWGSLASALVLFLPASVLLGTIAPQVVEALVETELDAGTAGGWVLAVGTLGSLAGVWGTSEVLVPELGLAWTFGVAATALAGGALLLALEARRVAHATPALLALPLALVAAPPEFVAPDGWRLLEERQSSYQVLRVLESEGGDVRHLQVNEALDSYQSVWFREPGWLPEGYYYNDAALPYFWSGEPRRWRVLVLGLGGGTAARVLEGVVPEDVELEIWGVELDGAMVDLARAHLDLALPPERVLADRDARAALRELPGAWDLVYLDCYANQIEIPPHLATAEFFREVRDRLAPGGWLAANVGGFDFADPLVCALGATVAHAFADDACVLRVPRARNWSLFARRDGALPVEPGGTRVTHVPAAVQAVLGPRELEDMARRFGPDSGRVLHDQDAPTEQLQRESLRRARTLLGGRG